MPDPREPFAWHPLWLDHSGLPDLIGKTIRHGLGWLVFRQVICLDCERNATPDAVEISLEELGQRLGLPGPEVRKTVLALRKLRLLACFLPETDEEGALLKVRAPLECPVMPAELVRRMPGQFTADSYFRYAQAAEELDGAEAVRPGDMQEIVDLYFNTVGLKMNTFILDELRLLTERFGRDEIRAVFRRAQRNEIRSLGWIAGQLARARTLKTAGEKAVKDRDND